MGFKKMLIAVDESTHAARAAEVGLELAGMLKAEVAFVHVFDERDIPGGLVTSDGGDEVEVYRKEAYRLLHGFAERAVMAPAALTFFEDGTAGTKIVEVATAWRADVIVMGTRGRSVVASALTGSVAQSVLRHAPCPVLAVRL